MISVVKKIYLSTRKKTTFTEWNRVRSVSRITLRPLISASKRQGLHKWLQLRAFSHRKARIFHLKISWQKNSWTSAFMSPMSSKMHIKNFLVTWTNKTKRSNMVLNVTIKNNTKEKRLQILMANYIRLWKARIKSVIKTCSKSTSKARRLKNRSWMTWKSI